MQFYASDRQLPKDEFIKFDLMQSKIQGSRILIWILSTQLLY